jgi:hypothetical protein
MKLSERRKLKRLREGRGVAAFSNRLTVDDSIPIHTTRKVAASLRESTLELGRIAFEKQGTFAFECPIISATNHEAGHCIMYRLLGYETTLCMIEEKPLPEENIKLMGGVSSAWLGFSEWGGGLWSVGPETDPLEDLDIAAIHISGALAELLFDREYHMGSSLDEWALFRGTCDQVSRKLRKSPTEISGNMIDCVGSYLKSNPVAHGNLAKALMDEHNLNPKKIASILSSVEPIGRRKMFLQREKMAA